MGARQNLIPLKREEAKLRPKHDSIFSKWKVLIDPPEWKTRSLGEDGIEKFKIENLPGYSDSAVYELGIAISITDDEEGSCTVIPVYIGQTKKLRKRLQSYHQGGSHLTNYGHKLFSKIIARGFPIVFRWAEMKNKEEAEKTEVEILKNFDYAWNKGMNGARRPNDILKLLDEDEESFDDDEDEDEDEESSDEDEDHEDEDEDDNEESSDEDEDEDEDEESSNEDEDHEDEDDSDREDHEDEDDKDEDEDQEDEYHDDEYEDKDEYYRYEYESESECECESESESESESE